MVALHRRETRTIAFRVHKEMQETTGRCRIKGVKFVERALRTIRADIRVYSNESTDNKKRDVFL